MGNIFGSVIAAIIMQHDDFKAAEAKPELRGDLGMCDGSRLNPERRSHGRPFVFSKRANRI
jgi:hypothetical protein